jgi:hypothetical protein
MSEESEKSVESAKSEKKNKKIFKLKELVVTTKETKKTLDEATASYKEIIDAIKTLAETLKCDFLSLILGPSWDYLERRAKWNLNFAKTTIDAIVKVTDEIEKLRKHRGSEQKENVVVLNDPLTCKLKARLNDIKHLLECLKQINETSKDGKIDITNSDRLFERCLDLLIIFQEIEKLLSDIINIDDLNLLREIMGPIYAAQRHLDKKRPIIVPGETDVTLISDKNSQFFSFVGYSWGFTYTERYYSINR